MTSNGARGRAGRGCGRGDGAGGGDTGGGVAGPPLSPVLRVRKRRRRRHWAPTCPFGSGGCALRLADTAPRALTHRPHWPDRRAGGPLAPSRQRDGGSGPSPRRAGHPGTARASQRFLCPAPAPPRPASPALAPPPPGLAPPHPARRALGGWLVAPGSWALSRPRALDAARHRCWPREGRRRARDPIAGRLAQRGPMHTRVPTPPVRFCVPFCPSRPCARPGQAGMESLALRCLEQRAQDLTSTC